MLFTIIIFILVLSVLVFAHELGHFVSARVFGLRPKEFGFGFPPRLFGVYKNKEGRWKKIFGKEDAADAADTVYSANWIPLGGFVNLGEDDLNETGPDSFAGKKIWQRAIILSAGVAMNIVLAAILISIGFIFGLPRSLDNIPPEASVTGRKIQIVQILPGSPAEKAGLKLGDVIAEIDGRRFDDYRDLQNYVDGKVGKNLDYKIERGAEAKNFQIRPEVIAETGKGGAGVAIAESGIVRYPFFQAIWEGIKYTALMTWGILLAFYELFKGLLFGRGVSADLAGPVGIAALTGQVARMGFAYLVQFAAMLSINLAIINFLPFPALDGGRVLFLIIEKIKGRPVKRELEALMHNIGFSLLMVLVLIVTFRDLSRFKDFFLRIWEKVVS